ncbi:hypothetical protein APSETT444_007484 [Aspergillus pseudonomiae]
MVRPAVQKDGQDDGNVRGSAKHGIEFDELLLNEAQARNMVSWVADSAGCVELLREAVVEEQHAGLQRPNQGHIARPAGEKTSGTTGKNLDLLGGQRIPLGITETDVGAILAWGGYVSSFLELEKRQAPTDQFQHGQFCLASVRVACCETQGKGKLTVQKASTTNAK